MMTARSIALTDGEHRRVAQIDRLVATGVHGVDELLASMSDPSWAVRRASVAALAELGNGSVGALCAWLRDRRTDERSIAAAVDALSTSVGTATTSEVIALLDDPGSATAADAARILGRRRADEAVPMLGRAIAHVDDNVAACAIEALGAIGGSGAIDELIAVVHDRNFFRTFPALQVLARSGDPRAVAPLASLLEDDVYGLEAARALGHTGSAQAIAPLASLLPRGEAIVRFVALALADLLVRAEWTGGVDHAVDTLRATVAPSLARFTGALEAANAAERAALASVIGWIGDASAIPALARLLADPEVHAVASEAIRRIGRAHEDAQLVALAGDCATQIAVLPVVAGNRAAPGVRALLGDDDPEIRARACHALARIGDSTVVPELFAMLQDPAPRVALAASTAIHSLGAPDTGARAIAALGFGSPAVRRYALQILAWTGSVEAFDAVCVAVGDGDPRIAELAVVALGAIDDSRVDLVLSDLARSPDPAVRASTMRAAVHRLGAGAGELLEHGLGDELGWVRYYACQGLGRIGRTQAVAQLVARLADETPYVRISAIEALSRLEAPAAWEALCGVIRSSDLEVRRAALLGIGLHPDDAAIPFLLEAALSRDVASRMIALSGLARRPEAFALDVLAAAALDDQHEIRNTAVSLLGERVDRPAAETVVDLALACEPHHPVHRTLSRPGAARIDAIAARLAIVDDQRASILAAALARMRDHAATRVLLGALRLANPSSRRAAATMLVAIGAAGSLSAVARIASEDPDRDVRCVCAALVAK